jgi:phosphoribosylaminoimidazole-succinocarboxamide synthase
MGSVKDLTILEKPTVERPGRARFTFSNRYSVFDWGEMPDQLESKGAAIALLSAYFFEKLEQQGVATHYLGLVEDGAVKKLKELKKPCDLMEIKLLRVVRPELKGDHYDYSVYKNEKGGYLIPLEVIYRNCLPAGSSVFKRLSSGQLKPADLGLDRMPEPGQKLAQPIYDVSTKLEITDRYLTWEEAGMIAGLKEKELADLKNLTGAVNKIITEEFSKEGLLNEDGKIEAGLGYDRKLMLVDVIGTLDECRFSYEGMPVSKEIARIYYRKSAWFDAVEEAKKKDRQNWKSICKVAPEKLLPRLKTLIEQIYCACTNEITGINWFSGTPALKEILKEIKGLLPG